MPHRRVGCTFVERTNRRGAHGASETGCDLRSTGGRCTWSRRHVGMPPYARSVRRTAMYTGPSRAADSRPYGKTGSVFVGADCISARTVPMAFAGLRHTQRLKPPLGAQGEVARRSRDGGDQNLRGPAAYNPSVSLRLTAPFTQGSLFLRRREPAVRRTAMHVVPGGPMWASAPTRGPEARRI